MAGKTVDELKERLTLAGVFAPASAKKSELEAIVKLLDEEAKEETFEVVEGVTVDNEITYATTTPVDFVDKVSVVLEDKAPESLPSEDRWAQMERIADRIASSTLISPPLRNKPNDILLVLLAAHDLGIPATQALSKLHVVDGKLGMSAEMMVALVLRDGHELWADSTNGAEHQIAYGRRKGSAEVTRSEFTLEDARTAGLADRATWKKYPRSMLWARAVSSLCRQAFPDAVAGVSYTPDEIAPADKEMPVGEEGAGKSEAIKQVAPSVELSTEIVEGIQTLSDAIAELKETSLADVDELKRLWKESGLPPLKSIGTMEELKRADELLGELSLRKPFEQETGLPAILTRAGQPMETREMIEGKEQIAEYIKKISPEKRLELKNLWNDSGLPALGDLATRKQLEQASGLLDAVWVGDKPAN